VFQQKVIFGDMKTACMLSASSPVLTEWMALYDVQNKQGPLVQILFLAVLLFKGREEWCTLRLEQTFCQVGAEVWCTPLVALSSVKM
jgi:hypothetical protein